MDNKVWNQTPAELVAERTITASKTVGDVLDVLDVMVATETITASRVATVSKKNGE